MALLEVEDRALSRGKVRIATLADVDRRNAISFELLGELESLIDNLERGGETVALVLAHDGPAFCSGTDLDALLSIVEDEVEVRSFLTRIVGLFARVERLPLPTVAAIEGVAVGGGFELALACDFRVMQPESWVSLPEVSLGAVPGGGGAHRLHRFVGRGRALDLALSGSRLTAGACERLGLCRVAESQPSLDEALELGDRLSHNSSSAMAATKQLLLDSEQIAPETADSMAIDAMIEALASRDGRIGLEAVQSHQSPEFEGTVPFD
jgi:methylglutaconyl-CoA hydratase